MGEPQRGKLVRDRIPEIIRASGAEPITYVAGEAEYKRRLQDKLTEEVAEFLDADPSAALEELGDVLEAVYANAAALGITPAQLEEIRVAKARRRGGFGGRIVWLGNLDAR